MFDVGFWELSLLAILGLIILGPDRLPRVAHTAGLWIGRARSAVRKLQREIQRELMIEETRAAVDKARAEVEEATRSIDPRSTSRETPGPADPHRPDGAEPTASDGRPDNEHEPPAGHDEQSERADDVAR